MELSSQDVLWFGPSELSLIVGWSGGARQDGCHSNHVTVARGERKSFGGRDALGSRTSTRSRVGTWILTLETRITFSLSWEATRVDIRLNKLAGSDLMRDLGHGK